MLFSLASSAQIELGMRMGLSSLDLANSDVKKIITTDGELALTLEEADYGVHFGLYSRLSLFNIYIEPNVLFNSSTLNYKLEDFGESGVVEDVKSATYRSIDLPVLIGMKIAFLRVQAGPVAHFYLDDVGDLVSIDGYQKNLEKSQYGFQAGLGLDIWKLRLDVNYEGNLSYFGDDINIGGNSYVFSDKPERIVASLGIRF